MPSNICFSIFQIDLATGYPLDITRHFKSSLFLRMKFVLLANNLLPPVSLILFFDLVLIQVVNPASILKLFYDDGGVLTPVSN